MSETGKAPILIVDDEEEILQSLRGLLRMEFDVHTAQSGPEALRVLEQQPIQVVLSDQRMPEMAGVDLLNQTQGERPSAIRVIFTGYSDIKAVIDAINKGHVFRYLTKPWDADKLLAVIREASEEYDRLAERQRLFAELQDYQTRCLALTEGLQEGQFGILNPEGEEEVQAVAKIGRALLDQYDQLVGLASYAEGGEG
jgi:DNA-binding NtrC family response regulator